MIFAFALIAIAMVVTIEGMMAEKQHRRAETGAALVSGTIGILFFIACAYAAGEL